MVACLQATAGFAQNGASLRTFTAANPENCGANVGIAFDGQDLIMTCLDSPVLDFLSTADGSLVRQVTVTGHKGLAAAAWDSKRGELWACDAPSGNSPGSDTVIYLINTTTGSSQKRFASRGCHDGLAYDGSDDTLWMGPDAADVIYHYRTDGTLIATYSGLVSLLGGSGRSGIAVGGSSLFLANDGGQQIYTLSKNLKSAKLLASFPSRLEDLECDNVTFAPKTAIWSQDAFDRTINAWQIPSGSCAYGGLAAAAPPVLGKAVDVGPAGGTVLVKKPGETGFKRLSTNERIPVASTVNTTHGRVQLISASNAHGGTQAAQFNGGAFVVGQRHGQALTTLKLAGGSFRACPRRAGDLGPVAGAARHHPVRHLFGSGHGSFSTSGSNASATVRGTVWLIEDYCDGTLVKVSRGVVRVRDFARHKTIIVRAPHSYFAAR